MDSQELIIRGLMFALVIPAIVFHEVAHGYVAYRLGDPTAKDRGRLSLNPIRHIDPFGTILLPLLMVAAFGFGFGYAKPVPVNPMYFADRRKGMFLTGIAGPLTNLALATAAGLLYRALGLAFGAELFSGLAGAAAGWVAIAAFLFARLNLVLMFFNLIPLPPLDGSRVLPLFLSDRGLYYYHQFERYGFLILFAGLWLLPDLLGFDPITAYFSVTVEPILRLLVGG